MTFKIQFFDENDRKKSTWSFTEAMVGAVDYGELFSEPQPNRRFFKCEIAFKTFNIDGVQL